MSARNRTYRPAAQSTAAARPSLGSGGWREVFPPAAGTHNPRSRETTRVTPFAHLHIGSFANYSLKFSFSAKERDTETGLSYFGARYYSSDLSIWLSVDPMSGKYPSLSSYVYCSNNPVKLVDPSGDSCAVLLAGNAAHGAGHAAILVQDEKRDNKWFLYSKNGDDKTPSAYKGSNDDVGYGGFNGDGFNSVEEFLNSEKENTVCHDGVGGTYYTEAYVLPTDSKQDGLIKSGMEQKLGEQYNLTANNCIQAVSFALNKAGVKMPSRISKSGLALSLLHARFSVLFVDYKSNTAIPNVVFPNIKKCNPEGKTMKPNRIW